jgi:hypothetical protein
MKDGSWFTSICIKTTNLYCSWWQRYLHTWRSISHKQGFHYIKQSMLHVTQLLVVQDRAGIKVISMLSSQVCCESFLMIHTQPHATAPIQYSSTIFGQNSIQTLCTQCYPPHVKKCFTLGWKMSAVRGVQPSSCCSSLCFNTISTKSLGLEPSYRCSLVTGRISDHQIL